MSPKSDAEVKMQAEVIEMRSRLRQLEETQTANHKENRHDIHELRNELQKLIFTLPEALRESMDKMGDKVAKQIADAIIPLQNRTEKAEDKIHGLELQWAGAAGKASAYAGMGAIGAGLLFEAAKAGLEHFIK